MNIAAGLKAALLGGGLMLGAVFCGWLVAKIEESGSPWFAVVCFTILLLMLFFSAAV